MTESMRIYERRMDAEGEARLTQLQQWVTQDQPTGDYTRSLKLWRDDVLTRIPNSRPYVLRIPKIFVSVLKLLSQNVVINSDGSVYTVVPGGIRGQLIISA